MSLSDKPKTLREMRDDAAGEPLEIAGKPAVACPYCGASMFVNGTQAMPTRVDRYEICRNKNCGRKFLTRQPQKVFVREVKPVSEEISSAGNKGLTIYRSAG